MVRARRAPAPPLRTFDPSPVTGTPIELREGRYGPYVTDGATNASLPRGMRPEDVTFEKAITLLAERAAKGPARGRRKKAAGKKAAGKKAARKKAAGKKSSRKTAARRRTETPETRPGEGESP